MIDWTKRAEEALGLVSLRAWRSSGNDEDARRFERLVPGVAAALAQAYGEGVGAGRAEAAAKKETDNERR